MPTIKEFEINKKKELIKKHQRDATAKMESSGDTFVDNLKEGVKMQAHKRRPSKEPKSAPKLKTEIDSEGIAVEDLRAEEQVEEPNSVSDSIDDSSESEVKEKVKVEFPGSSLLRSQFSKTFNNMDKIATDWVHDGDFEGLEVGHPLLQIAASKSLKKAKELEKKAQNTQAYAMAKIGFEYAKSKLLKK